MKKIIDLLSNPARRIRSATVRFPIGEYLECLSKFHGTIALPEGGRDTIDSDFIRFLYDCFLTAPNSFFPLLSFTWDCRGKNEMVPFHANLTVKQRRKCDALLMKYPVKTFSSLTRALVLLYRDRPILFYMAAKMFPDVWRFKTEILNVPEYFI